MCKISCYYNFHLFITTINALSKKKISIDQDNDLIGPGFFYFIFPSIVIVFSSRGMVTPAFVRALSTT